MKARIIRKQIPKVTLSWNLKSFIFFSLHLLLWHLKYPRPKRPHTKGNTIRSLESMFKAISEPTNDTWNLDKKNKTRIAAKYTIKLILLILNPTY